ncbi:MAG: lysophospholipid acyltransferase family protein [Myxococcota bacterium]
MQRERQEVELLDAADPSSFTYAAPSDPPLKRAIIQSVEAMTGQRTLRDIYMEYRRDTEDADTFWTNAVKRLHLDVRYNPEGLERIPKDGPVVIVANHPYGVIDGIVLAWLMERVRSDFKILVNSVLARAEEARPYLLPIDFAATKSAMKMNLQSRADAREMLDKGQMVVVFPGGTVSTAVTPFGRAWDPEWKPFTARLISRGNATVVPIFFDGQNSRLFQLASLAHPTLRLALFFHEARNKMHRPVKLTIGEPLSPAALPAGDPVALIAELRRRTYALGNIEDAVVAPTQP